MSCYIALCMASPKTTKNSKASKKTSRKPSGAKAAAKAAAAKFGSKSDFVRANPSLSAPEIVALASKQGIELTTSHIYNIRATDKKKRTGGGEATPVRSPSVALSTSDSENQFRTLVVRLGTDRVDQILNEFRSASPLFAVAPVQGQKVTRRRSAPVEQKPRPATVPPPAPAQEASHAG